jgi:hypothetical protein
VTAPGYSRGQFLRRGAIAAGGLVLLDPASAFARSAGDPRPIPGGFLITDDFFGVVSADPTIHVLPPGINFEMSTITDFDGVVGASEIRGTAHGSDGSTYSFDTDMRFMQGTYVDTDGRVRKGSFGFV